MPTESNLQLLLFYVNNVSIRVHFDNALFVLIMRKVISTFMMIQIDLGTGLRLASCMCLLFGCLGITR